jgi:hypothetical protein
MVMIILVINHTVLEILLIFESIFLQVYPGIPQIHNPRSGAVLQGVIAIWGSTDLAGYDHHQISFNYSDSHEDTWFLIAKSDSKVSDGELATWDTTTVADGNYKIRLEVFLINGNSNEIVVDNLRVRNYTPIETETNTPLIIKGEGIEETVTTSSGTLNPDINHGKEKNPLTVSMELFYKSLAGGAIISFSIFLFLTIYSVFRRKLK